MKKYEEIMCKRLLLMFGSGIIFFYIVFIILEIIFN